MSSPAWPARLTATSTLDPTIHGVPTLTPAYVSFAVCQPLLGLGSLTGVQVTPPSVVRHTRGAMPIEEQVLAVSQPSRWLAKEIWNGPRSGQISSPSSTVP